MNEFRKFINFYLSYSREALRLLLKGAAWWQTIIWLVAIVASAGLALNKEWISHISSNFEGVSPWYSLIPFSFLILCVYVGLLWMNWEKFSDLKDRLTQKEKDLNEINKNHERQLKEKESENDELKSRLDTVVADKNYKVREPMRTACVNLGVKATALLVKRRELSLARQKSLYLIDTELAILEKKALRDYELALTDLRSATLIYGLAWEKQIESFANEISKCVNPNEYWFFIREPIGGFLNIDELVQGILDIIGEL